MGFCGNPLPNKVINRVTEQRREPSIPVLPILVKKSTAISPFLNPGEQTETLMRT